MDRILKNSPLLAFDHHVLNNLRRLGVQNQALLVAVSGGLDSVTLLHCLNKIKPLLQIELYVAHIHHGWIHGEQGEYRNRVWKFVKKLADSYNLDFYSNLLYLSPDMKFTMQPEQTLFSEQDMRNFRYKCLEQMRSQLLEQKEFDVVDLCLAHTADDQLETRMIRLIRGTGLQGLTAMHEIDNHRLRPLLKTPRFELQNYTKKEALKWVEDPSNESTDPLRNWLRHKWLPQLEDKRPGATATLARSLQHLSEEKYSQPWDPREVLENRTINCTKFLELNPDQKQTVLACYMRTLGLKNYGLSHIKEVLKRLDTEKKEHSFSLLKHKWVITAQQIKASPQEASSQS